MFNSRFRTIAILIIFIAALSIGAGTAWAIPVTPEAYTGTVYVGGMKAGSGLVVTASMTGWTSAIGDVTDDSGVYELCVLCDPPSENASGIINFYVNGVQADETHILTPGGGATAYTYLDLHVAYIPTPTPTPSPSPTPTPTPTPSPTPVPISSNGSGTISAAGGTVNTGDGAIRITFPAGAFNASTNVSIQGGSCTHNGTADFVVGGTCFNVTPDGALGAAATICINLSVSDLSIALNQKSDPTLGYWFNNSWVEAGNVTRNGSILCAQTGHLSNWAVLVSTVNSTPTATPTVTVTASPSVTPTATSTAGASPTPTATQTPPEDDEGGTNWALVGGIAGGVLIFIAIVIFMNRRGGGGKKRGKPRRKPKRQPGSGYQDDDWK